MLKILLAMMVLILLVTSAGAVDCTRQKDTITHITDGEASFAWSQNTYQDPSSNRIYTDCYGKIWVSSNLGVDWDIAYDYYAVVGARTAYLFVTSSGTVLATIPQQSGTGYLHRLEWDTDELTRRTTPLTFEYYGSRFRPNGIDQAPDGKIYIGEYGSSEGIANVWRSDDDGVTWTQIYDGDSATERHIHCVGVDPYHTTSDEYHVYITVGDPLGGVPHGGIYKSVKPDQANPTACEWTCIMEESDELIRYKPTAIAFTPNYRIFGTDVGSGEYEEDVLYNQIFRTTDDINFTEELKIARPLVWFMRTDTRGVVYAGTIMEGPPTITYRVALYCSADEGDTWCEIYGEYVTGSDYNWKGVGNLSNFEQDAAFLSIADYGEDPPTKELYGLEMNFTWWIDDDGATANFTDISDAVDDVLTGRGDSLRIFPGSYTEMGIIPYKNMKLIGTTSNPHDTILWSGGTGTDMLTCSAGTTGIKVKNVEFRGNLTFDSGTTAIEIETGNKDSYFDNVWLKNLDGVNMSGVHASTGSSTRFHNGRVDSCDISGTSTQGAFQCIDQDDIVLTNSVFGDNAQGRSTVYLDQVADGSDSLKIVNILFESNTAIGTGYGAALHCQFHGTATSLMEVRNLTFYKNAPPAPADGQFSLGGNDAEFISHCAFYGDGTTYANYEILPSSTYSYCTVYNSGNGNEIVSATKVDCIAVDPLFSDMDRYHPRGFATRSKDKGGSNSSPFLTADASYMGWRRAVSKTLGPLTKDRDPDIVIWTRPFRP